MRKTETLPIVWSWLRTLRQTLIICSTRGGPCQHGLPDRSQMTETFPIDDARALTGNGRRACTARSHTAVASHILLHSVANKRYLVKITLQFMNRCEIILSEGRTSSKLLEHNHTQSCYETPRETQYFD